MSLYSDGCRALVAGAGSSSSARNTLSPATGARAGALWGAFPTPGEIDAHFNLVGAEYDALNLQITGSSVRQAFKDGWAQLYQTWTKFRADNQGGIVNWLSQATWGGVADQFDNYQAALAKWNDAFAKEGGQPIASVTPPGGSHGAALPEIPSSWLWAGGIILAGVTAIAVAKVAGK